MMYHLSESFRYNCIRGNFMIDKHCYCDHRIMVQCYVYACHVIINNNNCLKSNIQCIEIRVQWTVHLKLNELCTLYKLHSSEVFNVRGF